MGRPPSSLTLQLFNFAVTSFKAHWTAGASGSSEERGGPWPLAASRPWRGEPGYSARVPLDGQRPNLGLAQQWAVSDRLV